jgi:hypothetical protein
MSGNCGASNTYSQSHVDALSLIRFKFGLTLRETQGFAESNNDFEVRPFGTWILREKSQRGFIRAT